jgi:very-short-patch-repair endonuclease
MVNCIICGDGFDNLINLSNHLKQHDIKSCDYYDKYIGDGGYCYCGKSTGFLSLAKGYREYCSRKCMANSQVIKTKISNTSYDKFGVTNISKLQSVKDKKEKNSLREFGTKCSLQNELVKEKTKKTNLKNFGYEICQQSPIVQDKIKETMDRLYGGYSLQSPMIKEKIKNTNLKIFGVDNYSKTEEAKEIFRQNFIKRIEKIGKYKVYIGNHEPEFIKSLQNVCGYQILTDQNMFGFFPDGYIKEIGIIIELDEKYHDYPWMKIKDKTRQSILEKKLNAIFFRVRESDWLNNPEQIINNFKEVIR